jgi:methyl-accepting chemotaxis protein
MPELGNLTQFVSEVEQTVTACASKTEEISDLTNDLDKAEKDIEKHIGEIHDDAQKFTTDFEGDHHDTITGLDQFIALLEKLAGEGIGEFLKTFDDIDDTTEKAVEHHKSEMTSSFHELDNDGFKELEKGVHDCEQTVSEQEHETTQSFEQYQSHCEEQKNITSHFKEATASVFSTVSQNLTDTLTHEVSSGFESFTSGLTSNLGDIASGIADVGHLVTEGFHAFGKGSDDLGSHLTEMAGKIFTDSMSHMTDNLMHQLEQMFVHLCEQVFQGLMTEFTEQLAKMLIGQAITTASAEFAPFIIAAKIVLGIIEKLLSLLGM